MASSPHNRASLTAVRLQTSTNGERPKHRAAVNAAATGRRGPDGGQRKTVSANTSITARLDRAEGNRAAQLPSGSQTIWPGRL